MNRKSRFRAWDEEERVWVPTEHLAITAEGQLLTYDSDAETWCIEVLDLLVSYSTGVLDKNGQEIYEGDIIQIDDTDEVTPWVRGEKAKIEYVPARFRTVTETGEVNMLQQDTGDVSTVVGNIYSNPDLLK